MAAQPTSQRDWYATQLLKKKITIPAAAFEAKWNTAAGRQKDNVPEFFEGEIIKYLPGRSSATDKWSVYYSYDKTTMDHKLEVIRSYMGDAFPQFAQPARQAQGTDVD